MLEILLSIVVCALVITDSRAYPVNGGQELKPIREYVDPAEKHRGSDLQDYLEALQYFREPVGQENMEGGSRHNNEVSQSSGISSGPGLGTAENGFPFLGGMMTPTFYNHPFMTYRYPFRDEFGFGKDKRGKYMSLCHFKICNMGRKRWKSNWP